MISMSDYGKEMMRRSLVVFFKLDFLGVGFKDQNSRHMVFKA